MSYQEVIRQHDDAGELDISPRLMISGLLVDKMLVLGRILTPTVIVYATIRTKHAFRASTDVSLIGTQELWSPM